MFDNMLENILSPTQWLRIGLMFCYALFSWLIRFLQIFIAVFQALFVLISGEENDRLKTAGLVTSVLQAQIWLYLTYASDTRPFPLNDLPAGVNDLDIDKVDQPVYREQKNTDEAPGGDVFSDMSFTESDSPYNEAGANDLGESKAVDEASVPTLDDPVDLGEEKNKSSDNMGHLKNNNSSEEQSDTSTEESKKKDDSSNL